MYYICAMKLEASIKQTKPFNSELQKLVINIQFTASYFNCMMSQRLKPFDLSPQQFNVLRILKGKHPDSYSNQEITERMIDKSSNATRIADKLVEKKLITRTANKADRRAVDIRITAKGLALLEEINESLTREKFMPPGFNEEKARLMNEWLDELRG